MRKLHHGQVGRDLEREFVAFLAISLGSSLGGLLHIFGHTVEFLLGGVVGPVVGGIQRVFAELLRQLGAALLNLGKALTVCTLQLSAGEHKAAQRILMRLFLLWGKGGGVNGLVLGVQAFIGPQVGPELGDFGQRFVVGGTQFRAVGHAGEVADGAPLHAQLFGGDVQHFGDGVPVCGEVRRCDCLQRHLGALNQGVDGRADVCRRDAVKQRQARGFKQSIGHSKAFCSNCLCFKGV